MTQPYFYDRTELGGRPKRRRRWPLIAAAFLGVCAVAGVVTSRSDGSITKVPNPAIQSAGSGAASAAAGVGRKLNPPKPTTVTVAAGTWEVGSEIKPGTYTATAAEHCYWARLKGFDGDFDSIIANGNLDAGEHGRLTVKRTDKGVELSGDCVWKLVR